MLLKDVELTALFIQVALDMVMRHGLFSDMFNKELMQTADPEFSHKAELT